MKNDLNRNKFTEEKNSSDSPYEDKSNEQVAPIYKDEGEPGFFNKLFKYTLILAACVAIPFAVNNDLWSDVKGAYNTAAMFISDGESTPLPPVAPKEPKAPVATDNEQINQIIQDALGNDGNYSFSTSGGNSVISFSNPNGESYNVVKDADGKVVIENITGPEPINGEELSRRIEEKIAAKMAGLDEKLRGLGQQQQNSETSELEKRIEEAAERMVKTGPNGEIIIDQQALQEITRNATQLGLAVSGQVLAGMGNATTVEGNSQNYLDFLGEMKTVGLYDDFQEWEMDNFHEAGMRADEILQWSENGLFNELQSYEVVSLAEQGITPQTVLEWKESGLLGTFEAYELASFYEEGITAQDVKPYLNFSNEYNIPLKGFEISSLIEGNTSVSYLESLAEAGYLTKFPAYGWDELENGGVTAEFIKDLDNRGILDGLEFYEVVNLYEKSN